MSLNSDKKNYKNLSLKDQIVFWTLIVIIILLNHDLKKINIISYKKAYEKMFLRWIHNFGSLKFGFTFSKMAIISQDVLY